VTSWRIGSQYPDIGVQVLTPGRPDMQIEGVPTGDPPSEGSALEQISRLIDGQRLPPL
jgi:hypothetical protein